MQKLIKRTAEAQRNAANRAKKKAVNEYKKGKHERIRETKASVFSITTDIRRARHVRREAWELGPLAPRRDFDDSSSFAAASGGRMSNSSPLKAWEVEARCNWAGGMKYLNLVVGDRVVITQGPEKGTIDKIARIYPESATVELAESSKILVKVPSLYQKMDPAQGATAAMSAKLPMSAIRLVHPLTDPETGVTRDVIINALTRGPVAWHRQSGTRRWTRFVAGQNIAIPWPMTEPSANEDQPGDTRRADVEEPTFVPSLLRPPMPYTLINELRNPYSKFRTRHEAEFVARKEGEEEERRLRHKQHLQMLAPVQEFNRQQRDLRRARGQPELSEDMLSKIGEVIAKNKANALDSAGLSEVTTPPPS